MKTEILPAASEAGLARAVEVLTQGGLVAIPTDTVYGLAAVAFDESAVRSLYVVKERPDEKAIPVLVSSPSELDLVATDVNVMTLRLAHRFWPGALTLIVPTHPRLPEAVSVGTVGVRVPDHLTALTVLRSVGPLAVTSANLSGAASPLNAVDVLAQLNGAIPLILDGGTTRGGIPSTIADCRDGSLKILREGPLSQEQLIAALV